MFDKKYKENKGEIDKLDSRIRRVEEVIRMSGIRVIKITGGENGLGCLDIKTLDVAALIQAILDYLGVEEVKLDEVPAKTILVKRKCKKTK